MSARLLLACVLVSMSAVLAAGCGGGGGGGTGTLNVSITDAPFPVDCVEAAIVNVISVEARGESGWVDILLVGGGPAEIDLYDLRAGLSTALALAEVPTGAYSEIRVVIDMATLVFKDDVGQEFEQEFTAPSAASSGIKVKIDPPVLVASGQTTDLMLDVNLTESFHTAGEGGEPTCDDLVGGTAIFHPVIRAINEAETALVLGVVTDGESMPLGDVEVTVFPADTVVDGVTEASALTFSTPAEMEAPPGSYALALQPGTYDLYLRAPGTDARVLIIEDTVVVAGDILTQDLMLTP